jgi:hypothetical protein
MFTPALALIRAKLDRLGVALSALCLVHCVSGVVLVGLMGVGGGVLLDPHVHEIGLMAAIAIGAGLGFGLARHGRREPLVLGCAGLVLMAAGLVARMAGRDRADGRASFFWRLPTSGTCATRMTRQ